MASEIDMFPAECENFAATSAGPEHELKRCRDPLIPRPRDFKELCCFLVGPCVTAFLVFHYAAGCDHFMDRRDWLFTTLDLDQIFQARSVCL